MLDTVVIGPECFTDTEGLVISYKGVNYYKACDHLVYGDPEGEAAYCVKRSGHGGRIHEAYDGRVLLIPAEGVGIADSMTPPEG